MLKTVVSYLIITMVEGFQNQMEHIQVTTKLFQTLQGHVDSDHIVRVKD